ncbi:MAG: hypothetical protein KDD69_00425 [Bdellovibrionales bacterium]|nr:hypothetical protein [Bdellovibrionales bacterium]
MRQNAFIVGCLVLLVGVAQPVSAESGRPTRAQRVKAKIASPLKVFSPLTMFRQGFDAKGVVDIVDVSDVEPAESVPAAPSAPAAVAAVPEAAPQPRKADTSILRYVSENPADTEILPPDQTPSVRVNPDAPGCFKALVAAKRSGDSEMANEYAKQCIRYQQHYFFEVREIAQMLGQALIDQNVIDEDSWVGVTQMMDRELAVTRSEMGVILKPTHDVAMQRIVPDTKGEIEIFYFFTMTCSWCRYMAPDVERLWRITKADPRVKFTALSVESVSQDWLDEYREYTGMTAPILDGSDLARQFNIKFVPAVVIVASNSKKAYLKTGQQSFERMYEFARTVQGLPATVTAEFKRLLEIPIGQAEKMKEGETKRPVYVMSDERSSRGRMRPVAVERPKKEDLVGRF